MLADEFQMSESLSQMSFWNTTKAFKFSILVVMVRKLLIEIYFWLAATKVLLNDTSLLTATKYYKMLLNKRC